MISVEIPMGKKRKSMEFSGQKNILPYRGVTLIDLREKKVDCIIDILNNHGRAGNRSYIGVRYNIGLDSLSNVAPPWLLILS